MKTNNKIVRVMRSGSKSQLIVSTSPNTSLPKLQDKKSNAQQEVSVEALIKDKTFSKHSQLVSPASSINLKLWKKNDQLEGFSQIQTEVIDSGRSKLIIHKNDSYVLFKKFTNLSQKYNQINEITPKTFSHLINNENLTTTINILFNQISRSTQTYQVCRKIQANQEKLMKAFLMISPPFELDDNLEDYPFSGLQNKLKRFYSLDITQEKKMKTLHIIPLSKIIDIMQFASIQLQLEQIVLLASSINLIYFDQDYGYFTNYLQFLSVVNRAVEMKIESTKMLMQSLLPNHQKQNLDFRQLLIELDSKKKHVQKIQNDSINHSSLSKVKKFYVKHSKSTSSPQITKIKPTKKYNRARIMTQTRIQIPNSNQKNIAQFYYTNKYKVSFS